MTRVLVPTDFSENAWNAIQYGVRLYQNTPCVFYLLHVHISKRQENSGDTFANGMLFELPQRVSRKKKLEELKESLEGCFENPNHRFESLQVNGLFVDGIRRAIAEHQIDLIVMGTKGASGLKEATIGSRTGEVITRVKCPVLVVPEHAEYKGVKQIVFPTDFNCFYKSRILSTLSGIMALDQAKVNILHIGPEAVLSDQQHENKVVLEDFFENGPHEFHFLFERNIEAGLNAFSEDHQVDLIAMVARNVNFFQRLLFKPTVAKISFHTRIPFLVLHE